MSVKEKYRRAHYIAKAIVCAIVILLLLMDIRILDMIAVIVWFFGINPIGYVVENVLHFKHRHNKF